MNFQTVVAALSDNVVSKCIQELVFKGVGDSSAKLMARWWARIGVCIIATYSFVDLILLSGLNIPIDLPWWEAISLILLVTAPFGILQFFLQNRTLGQKGRWVVLIVEFGVLIGAAVLTFELTKDLILALGLREMTLSQITEFLGLGSYGLPVQVGERLVVLAASVYSMGSLYFPESKPRLKPTFKMKIKHGVPDLLTSSLFIVPGLIAIVTFPFLYETFEYETYLPIHVANHVIEASNLNWPRTVTQDPIMETRYTGYYYTIQMFPLLWIYAIGDSAYLVRMRLIREWPAVVELQDLLEKEATSKGSSHMHISIRGERDEGRINLKYEIVHSYSLQNEDQLRFDDITWHISGRPNSIEIRDYFYKLPYEEIDDETCNNPDHYTIMVKGRRSTSRFEQYTTLMTYDGVFLTPTSENRYSLDIPISALAPYECSYYFEIFLPEGSKIIGTSPSPTLKTTDHVTFNLDRVLPHENRGVRVDFEMSPS